MCNCGHNHKRPVKNNSLIGMLSDIKEVLEFHNQEKKKEEEKKAAQIKA